MICYSDVLTDDDLRRAAPRGVIVHCTSRSSRKRARAWDVRLEGVGARHTRKTTSGTRGAGSYFAATWDDHGEWMAELFAKDPAAVLGIWDGLADFTAGTNGKYNREEAA